MIEQWVLKEMTGAIFKMNIYLKSVLAGAVGVMASTAMAADGTINFTGTITTASCTISNGPGTSAPANKVIDVNLGTVSVDSLGEASGGASASATKPINLSLNCGNTAQGLTTVKLAFDPRAGSGLDSKNSSLLKTTGSATGVGIGLFGANNQLLNLIAGDTINAALTSTGTGASATYAADLNLRAGYVKNGDAIVPGAANGSLPFSLSYE